MTGQSEPPSWWRSRRLELLLAFALMTRFSLPHFVLPATMRPSHAAWAYPVAGLAVGAVTGVTLMLAAFVTPAPVAAVLAIVAGVFATGCFHEDALADFADGVGGGRDRARKLEIMKDSRIGVYGVVALILALALKVMAIGDLVARLGTLDAALLLVGVTAGARAALVVPYRLLTEARGDGLAASAGQPSVGVLAVGCVLASAVLVFAAPTWPMLIWAVTGLAVGAIAVTYLAWRYLRGYTGDVLGATVMVAETSALILLAGPAVQLAR